MESTGSEYNDDLDLLRMPFPVGVMGVVEVSVSSISCLGALDSISSCWLR